MTDYTAGYAAQELDVYGRFPLKLVRGQGCSVWDEQGRRFLDLYGGHAVALTGHCHPRVVQAVAEQAGQLLFYSSSVHLPHRDEATRLLLTHAPFEGSRLFHCVSGAEANEVALKLARKVTGRRQVVSFHGAFHGRTLGALSACGIEKYRKTAAGVLVREHRYLRFGELDDLKLIDAETAAVLCEPIQSLAGAFTAELGYYQELARRTAAAGAVLIFDEVQTGLGRTGTFFFSQGVGVRPPLTTLAKGIASGVPAAAVIVAPHLAREVKRGDQGSTFGGGPLAMAALRATQEVIRDEGLVRNAALRGEQLRAGLSPLPGVREVRGRGLLIGIGCEQPANEVQRALLAEGILVGTSADPHTLRLLPPLVLSEAEAAEGVDAFRRVLSQGER